MFLGTFWRFRAFELLEKFRGFLEGFRAIRGVSGIIGRLQEVFRGVLKCFQAVFNRFMRSKGNSEFFFPRAFRGFLMERF